ncbi:hypothetical protein [Verrucomicrobium spinosum]|uniref:hypothetical protein n=1 Tax=Verrucomicrobium spinosum TaxID=2736 RepID=UPI0009461AC1|nr:hypothetical protein [Verrucomicrobium spinosum]
MFTRDVATGLLTRFEQKITRLTDLGRSLDVGFDFSSGATPSSTASSLEGSDRIVVMDQPLANSSQAGLQLTSDRVTYASMPWAPLWERPSPVCDACHQRARPERQRGVQL